MTASLDPEALSDDELLAEIVAAMQGIAAPVEDETFHGRPTMAETVAAVRRWLETDVMPGTEGRLSFHARVAANMLAQVERELASVDDHEIAHTARLAALGVSDEAELAHAIRAGALDHRYDEVKEAVMATVQAKLEVANPRYLDRTI